jgi:hypothetical protein
MPPFLDATGCQSLYDKAASMAHFSKIGGFTRPRPRFGAFTSAFFALGAPIRSGTRR